MKKLKQNKLIWMAIGGILLLQIGLFAWQNTKAATAQTICVPEGRVYVSGWESITPGGTATFSHDLGTDAILVCVQFRAPNGIIYGQHNSNYNWSGYGIGIYEINSTQIKVAGGNAGLVFIESDGSDIGFANGAVRVIAYAG